MSAVRDQGVPGVGNRLFLLARGWGIDREETKKGKSLGSCLGGGMVTCGIEPYITLTLTHEVRVREVFFLYTNASMHSDMEYMPCFDICQLNIT